MTIIAVPKPSKKAINLDRPVSSLLQSQIKHLQHAEQRLPPRYRSEIYIHAIRTEGEAARYIREVTEAIHQAHADAVVERARRASVRHPRRKTAPAAQRSTSKGRSRATSKSRTRATRK